MRIIRHTDLIEKPWKNGGGITRDIAALHDGTTLLWRVSMADVDADGPFSEFDGLTRILTVIKGTGMILHGVDDDLKADFAVPVVFDGAAPITAELRQGPIRDFNLMYNTARFTVQTVPLHGPRKQTFGPFGKTTVIHCIQGEIHLGNRQVLGLGDTAIATDQAVNLSAPNASIALCFRLKATPKNTTAA